MLFGIQIQFKNLDVQALMWIQEHHGSVQFHNGYIRFNENESIEQNMDCPFQEYVVVRIGIEKRAAKTITDATLSLQKWYFGTKWSEQLKSDLYS
ncbi:hypothetical protein SMD22_00760 (plasmid) [Brevibacillus halotolerans]|nr:hypothetical protein SMD22_00760 [Brevibacillus halotolerans]